MTQQRLDFQAASPTTYEAMANLQQVVTGLGLDHTVSELVKIRTSQINGCAFCIDMHARDAREYGEQEHRIWALNAWREAPFFDERERAALALAEEMTKLPSGHGVSDETYAEAARVFSEDELIALMWTVTVINGWNRMCVTTQRVPVGREPRLDATLTA